MKTLLKSRPAIVLVELEELHEPETNENVMSAVDFDALREEMLHIGYTQPILVRPLAHDAEQSDAGYETIDGVHRVRAMQELMALVPSTIVDETRRAAVLNFQRIYADGVEVILHEGLVRDGDAKLAQLAHNRLRGRPDLAKVADALADLCKNGFEVADLALSGFTSAEVADLLASAAPVAETPAPDAGDFGGAEDEPPGAPKPFSIELVFATAKDRDRVKRGLRKAAGGGKQADMSLGALRLVEGA